MGDKPSIKGSVFQVVVEDVGKVLAEGSVSHTEAVRWLQPDDFAYLDREIYVSSWYDIRSYERMSLLLRDVVGGGSNAFLVEKGRETARRLLEAGFYAQLEYLQRTEVATATDPMSRFVAFGRDLRKFASLSRSILNFSTWTSKPDSDHDGRYVLEITDARDFPEVLAWRSEGFMNELSSQHGTGDLWSWKRTGRSSLVYSMIRDL